MRLSGTKSQFDSWILYPDLNGTWTGLPSCNYIKLERDSDSSCMSAYFLSAHLFQDIVT